MVLLRRLDHCLVVYSLTRDLLGGFASGLIFVSLSPQYQYIYRLLIQEYTAIGFLSFVMIIFFLQPPELSELGKTLTVKQKLLRIDWLGTILLITAFTCFFLAAQWGGTTYPWSNSRVWGCILGFFLQVIAFVYLQVRLQDR
jgi:hypothetical protein